MLNTVRELLEIPLNVKFKIRSADGIIDDATYWFDEDTFNMQEFDEYLNVEAYERSDALYKISTGRSEYCLNDVWHKKNIIASLRKAAGLKHKEVFSIVDKFTGIPITTKACFDDNALCESLGNDIYCEPYMVSDWFAEIMYGNGEIQITPEMPEKIYAINVNRILQNKNDMIPAEDNLQIWVNDENKTMPEDPVLMVHVIKPGKENDALGELYLMAPSFQGIYDFEAKAMLSWLIDKGIKGWTNQKKSINRAIRPLKLEEHSQWRMFRQVV